VETAHSVLLIENKVTAPESGPEQYAGYLAMATELAGGRPLAAVLFSRERRSTPPGWTATLLHAEVAELLEPLCRSRELSAWARILVALVVADLRHADPGDRLVRVRELLDRAPGGDLRPLEVRRISRLLEGLPDGEPWEVP
jgi:hypothetical protein